MKKEFKRESWNEKVGERKKEFDLSEKIIQDPMGIISVVVEDIKEFIDVNEKDIDKEFIEAEKGIPSETAAVLYVFKQKIKRNMRKRVGKKLVK